MTNGHVNEFNALAAPTEEVRRRLLYLAMTDSGSVLSAYRPPGYVNGEAARENDRVFARMAHLVSQDEIRRIHDKLDLLEQAAIEALYENEERLRDAREALERMDADARSITMPDGTVQKVYRDGDQVRFGDGSIVDPEIVSAPEVSDDAQQWDRRESFAREVIEAEKENGRIVNYLERIETSRDRIAPGREVSQSDVDSLFDDLGRDMPASVRNRYAQVAEADDPMLAAAKETASPTQDRTDPAADAVPGPVVRSSAPTLE